MPRLFFALWPDEAAAAELGRLACSLAPQAGGKPVPESKIHLTLAFLGDVAAERVADAATVRVAGRAFAMSLDCVGAFRGARVGWAGTTAPPAGLLKLQAQLAQELRARGFVLEDRPFAPHLTLARGIRKPVARAAIEPVTWRAGEYTLMRSEPGTGRYSRLETWRLSG